MSEKIYIEDETLIREIGELLKEEGSYCKGYDCNYCKNAHDNGCKTYLKACILSNYFQQIADKAKEKDNND